MKVILNMTTEPPLRDAIDAVATKENRSRSSMAEILITEALKARKVRIKK